MSNDKTGAYASAELGSELRGESPGESVRSFAGLVDDPAKLRLLNYYDSLLPADTPIEETEIGRLIIRNAATETIDQAVRHGSVSQMKAATGLTGQTRDGGDLYADAAEQLSYEGSVGLVFGSPGSGKTATTLDVANAWKIRTGGTIIGNTSWDGFDQVVSSDREMLEAMAETTGPVLAILDEIAQELSGFGTGNKAAEKFSDSLLFVRKQEDQHGQHPKRGSVLLVGHTRTKTAKSIRRVASFAINKPSRSDPGIARLLSSEGGKDQFEEAGEYKGLTDTAENYPEHEASTFNIVMNDEEADADNADQEDITRSQEIARAIHAVENLNKTQQEAADMSQYSKGWINTRIREYKDGEHRELVEQYYD